MPGYMALFLDQPVRIVLTILLSIATLYLINFLSQYTVLYGKRKFALMVMVSFILKFLFREGTEVLSIGIITTTAIGYIVPGITAQDMDRQGILKTVSSMLIVACVIKLITIVMGRGILI